MKVTRKYVMENFPDEVQRMVELNNGDDSIIDEVVDDAMYNKRYWRDKEKMDEQILHEIEGYIEIFIDNKIDEEMYDYTTRTGNHNNEEYFKKKKRVERKYRDCTQLISLPSGVYIIKNFKEVDESKADYQLLPYTGGGRTEEIFFKGKIACSFTDANEISQYGGITYIYKNIPSGTLLIALDND